MVKETYLKPTYLKPTYQPTQGPNRTGEYDFTETQEYQNGPVKGETNLPGSEGCLAETVQGKSRQRFPVLFGLIEQDQERAPALQRQSREKKNCEMKKNYDKKLKNNIFDNNIFDFFFVTYGQFL